VPEAAGGVACALHAMVVSKSDVVNRDFKRLRPRKFRQDRRYIHDFLA
jgi:hypothetical protein